MADTPTSQEPGTKADTPTKAEQAPAPDTKAEQAGVATPEENAQLEHTDGGRTTRDDRLDAGVPMLAGEASEPTGPEDALGEGPKRGDYAERVFGNPLASRPINGGGKPVTVWTDDVTGAPAKADAKEATGHIVDYEPTAELRPQRPNVFDRGDAPGLKGGVDTDPASLPDVGHSRAADTQAPRDTANR